MISSSTRPLPVITSILGAILSLSFLPAQGQVSPSPEDGSLNRAERIEWFRDQGFGLFIHWSVDSQLGVSISHSLVGASDSYVDHFFKDLPETFYPSRFNPDDWARLARLAGVRYVVFTAKHHSGFAMYSTATTSFNVMETPFHRDITAEVLQAFRGQGIAAGLYFSPDDFYWLHTHGKLIERNVPEVQPVNNSGLMAYDQSQLRELLTHYGPISVVFFDGQPNGLRDLAWHIQPETVVTRGALQTPEQYIPGRTMNGAWEACITMGESWQYQPQDENYKSVRELIRLLIQTRARGGNLLLNVGPQPDGELPIEQEERLRQIALWMFVNSEAIYSVRPWIISNEGAVWFTKRKDQDTIYAMVDLEKPWQYGKWQDIVLHSVKATSTTEVEILGANGKIVEYEPEVDPKPEWHMDQNGLHLHLMKTQRLQDNRKWPNPVVVRITHVEPGFVVPRVLTVSAKADESSRSYVLSGGLANMADSTPVNVGFEYRAIGENDVHVRSGLWTFIPVTLLKDNGTFSYTLRDLPPGNYEFHAVAKHPLITLDGTDLIFRIQ